jgi:inhibitor of KinA sporulation pathway (predicted exonuclease)
MKINNNFLVFDLEATSNQEDEDSRPEFQENNFIIQVGAVLLDKDLNAISHFSTLVRPEEPVTPFITQLTGITQEEVDNALYWSSMSKVFEQWISDHVPIKSVRLCAWGNYFDINLLRKCYAHYKMQYPFSGTCFDIKTLAMLWCSLSNRRTDKLGVQKVMEHMGMNPDGRYHNAYVDALCQMKIMKRVFEDFGSGLFMETKGDGLPYKHVKVYVE